MKVSQLANNLDLEELGVWVPIRGDFHVKISRASSKRSRAAWRRYMRPHERKIATGAMSDEEAAKHLALYIVHGLMHDWRGAQNDDGTNLPFSADVAVQLLSRADMKDIRGDIQEAAGERDLFVDERAEDVAALKNA